MMQRRKFLAKQLKKPIDNVLRLMQKGFSDEQYVCEFKNCYEYLWNDIKREQRYFCIKNKTFKGSMPLLFPSPYRLVICTAFHKLKRARKAGWVYEDEETIKYLRLNLIEKCKLKLQRRETKHRKNIQFLQNVAPGYADSMIQTYFYYRYHHREDVDIRYYVLKEIGKFNSPKFIGFLKNVMAKDKNDKCREYAQRILHGWGIKAELQHKRYGNRNPSDKIVPTYPDNPTDQLALIERMQMEKDKSYNIFLSHRSTDESRIIDIKNGLNKMNLSVYVDWMIDRDGLEPKKYNEHTWPVLQHRMIHCDKVLYVHTANCADSKWIPREIDYARKCNLSIIVYNVDGSLEPDYCGGLDHITELSQINTKQL